MLKHYRKMREKFDTISTDPEQKDNSTYFGKMSIIYTIILGLLVAASVYLILYGVAVLLITSLASHSLGRVLGMSMMVLGGIFIIISLTICLPRAINCTIKQLKLNRKPIGKISLALLVIVVVTIITLGILKILHAF